jgi:hypothetical protein
VGGWGDRPIAKPRCDGAAADRACRRVARSVERFEDEHHVTPPRPADAWVIRREAAVLCGCSEDTIKRREVKPSAHNPKGVMRTRRDGPEHSAPVLVSSAI